jgi:hypothetical protein
VVLGSGDWTAGVCSGSRERLFETRVAALTGEQDAVVSDRSRDGPAGPRIASELAVPIPHGPLEPEGELSRALHRSTSMSSSPSRRLSVLVPVPPPPPARPENGITAIAAPRRSSSSHTALRPASAAARRAQPRW